ncbi:beta-N-acetylhexosaminidase [Alistipes sp.]|uniref:beta-N-acetylhexosaminidase n=1 Tax=Alistipes sp. TaxID=1872444 RepID=UPI003AB17E70
MGKLRILLVLGVLCCGCGRVVPADDPVSVVPAPVSVTPAEGVFRLSASTRVIVGSTDGRMSFVTDALNGLLGPVFGKGLVCLPSALVQDGAVNFIETDSIPSDGYSLTITADRVEVRSGGPEGAFYAVQTLRQLMPAAAFGTGRVKAVELPAVVIADRPGMGYRGMMLDVARHFFTVEEVKRTLDLLAMHKMNVFHWHLTDDQGWRIEIAKYPELTRIGSVRSRTLIGKDPGGEYDETCRYDETPHGGFYTQAEIRDVVEYAARRFITVIPEIEFPGHAVAALASYPWLGCTGEQYEVRQTWDIDDRVFCVGRDSTFRFIEDVLEEVVALFPSTYIHIGGDECPTKMWEQCPRCRARMHAEGLTRPRQLQGYATTRIERFLNAHGRKLIGWDEILDGGVSRTAVVMSWRGTEGGIRAARQGNEVVMAPTTHCYFDYYQTADTAGEPLAWGGYLPLAKVYALNPYEGLDSVQRASVLGVQANLWTEYIPDFAQAQYMLLPRLGALAEVGWSPDRKDYAEFLPRLKRLTRFYDAWGYVYAPHPFAD